MWCVLPSFFEASSNPTNSCRLAHLDEYLIAHLERIASRNSAGLQKCMSSKVFRKDLLCSESAVMVSLLRSPP